MTGICSNTEFYAFLRMAVIQMRHIADDEPAVADRLGVVVEKCETEIEELTKRFRLSI